MSVRSRMLIVLLLTVAMVLCGSPNLHAQQDPLNPDPGSGGVSGEGYCPTIIVYSCSYGTGVTCNLTSVTFTLTGSYRCNYSCYSYRCWIV